MPFRRRRRHRRDFDFFDFDFFPFEFEEFFEPRRRRRFFGPRFWF